MKATLYYYRHRSLNAVEFATAEEAFSFAIRGEDDGELSTDRILLENGKVIASLEFSQIYRIWDDEKKAAAIATLLTQKGFLK